MCCAGALGDGVEDGMLGGGGGGGTSPVGGGAGGGWSHGPPPLEKRRGGGVGRHPPKAQAADARLRRTIAPGGSLMHQSLAARRF